jgi:hypothetical protein
LSPQDTLPILEAKLAITPGVMAFLYPAACDALAHHMLQDLLRATTNCVNGGDFVKRATQINRVPVPTQSQ